MGKPRQIPQTKSFVNSQEIQEMIDDLKKSLDLDNDTDVIRYCIKQIHRKEILNGVVV